MSNEFLEDLLENSRLNYFCDCVAEDVGGSTELRVTKVYDGFSSREIDEAMIIDGNTQLFHVRNFASKICGKYDISYIPPS